MEREKQKRPQPSSSGIKVEKLRGASPDSQSAIYASTEDPSLSPRYPPESSSDHSFHEISLESPGTTSPTYTHHTFAINNAWGPPPAFLAGAPKYVDRGNGMAMGLI